MINTLSRREFLKTGLAATAAVVVGPRLARADNNLLFEKTWIKSLELSNRAIRSSTWSGVGDQKGYVTDRALEFYGELAKGDIGLILTGYQYVMTNGQGLPYMLGNYDDTQVRGLKKLVDTVHREGGKIAVQLVHCLAKANPKLFFREGDELWGASAVFRFMALMGLVSTSSFLLHGTGAATCTVVVLRIGIVWLERSSKQSEERWEKIFQ